MGTTLGIRYQDKAIAKYCEEIENLYKHGQTKEGNIVPKFDELLNLCAKKVGWLLSSEYVIKRIGKRPDGAFLDQYSITQGLMEAKDDEDDLENEVKSKFSIGYPRDNIIFWQPNRVIIYQNGKKVFDEPIGAVTKDLVGKKIAHTPDHKKSLATALNMFFEFEPPHYEQWLEAVDKFKQAVPELSAGLLEKIGQAKKENKKFVAEFANFREICKQSINPNISDLAIEEMIIQHLLTERLLRKVFDMDRFNQDNTIARQLEVVISALTSESFNRKEFLGKLDGFYKSIEAVADDIKEYSDKQAFINSIYEKFFQGWAIKSADTLGIVYTPQPVVDFMVRSVEEILKAEFGKSLGSENVHILDPFVGTGNFITRVIKEISPSDLEVKYKHELHCNEIALMPYYIASMNIEHEYFDTMKKSLPFQGICFADTFEMYEMMHKKAKDDLFVDWFGKENTQRVNEQIKKPIFVIITNPPYNTNQANENDNNKNRKYQYLEEEISATYARDSKATLKNKLSDPYVKAIKWASKRIGEEGVVAMITNNSFMDNVAFDGMRKHLAKDFSKVYHINLKGNARTSGERRRMEKGNIFNDQIRVSVGISFFIKHAKQQDECEIYYNEIGDYLDSGAKKEYLVKAVDMRGMVWKRLTPDKNNIWLTEGMSQDFEELLPMGDKEEKGSEDCKAIFRLFSLGVATNRDEWVYNFHKESLEENVGTLIKTYNSEVERWKKISEKPITKEGKYDIDNFIFYDEKKIKWSSTLKIHFNAGEKVLFTSEKVKKSIYRPFVNHFLYYDRILLDRPSHFDIFFPTPESENENKVICMSAVGNTKDFQSLMTNVIADLHLTGDSQCFPFYTYNEDGSGRRENITDWALDEFRKHYNDSTPQPPLKKGGLNGGSSSPQAEKGGLDGASISPPLLKGGRGVQNSSIGDHREITKWDIFYYIYALLHHPAYREEYKENLKRSLPRIPFAPDFWAFADAGKRLADLHINYEQAPIHKLDKAEDREAFKDVQFTVKKMRLSQDKTELFYNEAITFKNIPKEVCEYKLGNRSALEWIVDQYQVTTDPRSGITQDPNNFDGNQRYIFDLVGKIVTVSLETVKIVNKLAELPYK